MGSYGRAIPALRTEFLTAEDPSADYARMERASDSADVTIVSSYVGQNWDAVSAAAPTAFMAFINHLVSRGRKAHRSVVRESLSASADSCRSGIRSCVGRVSGSQVAAARALLGTIRQLQADFRFPFR